MTAEHNFSDLPTWAPDFAELADLELLLSGAFTPLTGFLGSIDTAAVIAGGRLADGTPWPVPVVLTVPEELTKEDRLVLQDPEGLPLAVLRVTEAWQDSATGTHRLAGPVEPLGAPAHGPFRGLRHRPGDPRLIAEAAPGPATESAEGSRAPSETGVVLAVATREPLHRRQLGQLKQVTEKLAAGAGLRPPAGPEAVRILVLALMSDEHDDALVRSLLAVRRELPEGALIVPVPLTRRTDPVRDLLLRSHVAKAYGATHLFGDPAEVAEAAGPHQGAGLAAETHGTAVPLIVPEPWAYDADVEVWRPVAKIEADHARVELTRADIDEMLDRGDPIPEWFTPPAVAAELAAARPPRHRRGVTVFFTGLSGSGKSTIARGLADALIEHTSRTVSLLDGDVVRRLLSAGLTFSKTDRDLNIRRIGYVAAEVTRHGGVAVCAPIAPYAATRAEVRRMVSAAGDFVLIHVATPLAECERRDRKGLYAKARAGLVPEFTGISDPYEEPDDADLVLDTSQLTPDEAVRAVLDLLEAGGWVRPIS
ncbi:adenylyl-sulfate kinase [Actinomadura sp. HBU206391]|uniref:adenylyl-sulfate kinase n=1 Tax=Actinomadura sp. HBU206391 TaxID=2731692 RepID=UPI00164F6A87|nr:adenylyl-sulfate kinase [Actinomadura sp. HBU206391]MBC6459061.1 adenylyl-sulfate kinase [Actinomadura sp. HBU206391]